LTEAVAHATRVVGTYAIVHIIAHVVGIRICRAIAPALSQSIKLVAFTVAVALRDVIASAFVNLTRTVAHAASVVGPHAIVLVVTDVVLVHIRLTISSAVEQRVELISVAVAIPFRNVVTTAVVNGTRSIANPTSIFFPNASVHVVTDAVLVNVRGTLTTTHPCRIFVLA
jgi:hypothetical protein